jgi:PIN domain nuclease of toxin-antitoxin system
MRVLLDTNALLWLLKDDSHLSPTARQLIEQAEEIAVSEVSLWEISIKININKLQPIPELLNIVKELGFRRLSLSDKHLRAYESLPMLHRDPFDRMLVAQSSEENLTLVTSDTFLEKYSIQVASTH